MSVARQSPACTYTHTYSLSSLQLFHSLAVFLSVCVSLCGSVIRSPARSKRSRGVTYSRARSLRTSWRSQRALVLCLSFSLARSLVGSPTNSSRPAFLVLSPPSASSSLCGCMRVEFTALLFIVCLQIFHFYFQYKLRNFESTKFLFINKRRIFGINIAKAFIDFNF